MSIRCALCTATVTDIYAAQLADWTPPSCVYVASAEADLVIDEPICLACSEKHVVVEHDTCELVLPASHKVAKAMLTDLYV